MKRIILALLSLMLSASLFAQIQGYVLDKTSNQPLPGCLVKIKEINKATLTDVNGFFRFNNIPRGNFTLEFSYLGYQDTFEKVKYEGKTVNIKVLLTPSLIKTEEVIVTGWIPGSQHTSALKVDNINLNIKDQVIPSILSSLTSVPGVDIISKGLGIGTPVIRGLSRTNIVVLNNGFRMENYQFSENHPFFISRFGAKKIEVIKGPSSLLYGSDAIGGVINLLWEDPATVGHFNADYAFQYNTNTRGVTSSAGIKASSDRFSWGIRTGINLNGDMRDALGQQITNTRFLMENVKSFLIFNNEHSSHKFFFQYDRDKLGLSVAPAMHLVHDNKLFPENFYQDLSHVFLGNKNTFFPNSSATVHINFSYEFNHRGITVSKAVPMPVDMKLKSLTYEVYLTYEHNRITTILGSQGWGIQNNNFAATVFLPDYKTFNTSAFGLVRFLLTRKIHLISGLRYDYTKINFLPISDTTTSPIIRNFNNLSASFGGTIHLTHSLLLRFNTATAYRNPNAAELGELGIHAYRYEVGNNNLKPQHSLENDLSLHIHTSRIVADINVFHNRLKNYIFLAPTADTADNGMKIYTYNQSNALIYGLETGLKASIIPQLTSRIVYSYLKTRDSLGNPLPLIPQNKLKAFLICKIKHIGPVKNFSLTVNPVYAFAYPNPANGEQPSNAYFLLNMSLSGKIQINKTQTITVFVNGYNLTNTVYSDHLSSLREVGFYDMGRNISFGLHWILDKIH